MEAKEFYDRIKDLVKAENITIEELCKRIDLSFGNYQNLRSRESFPKLPLVVKMAEALNVSLDYLAYGHEKQVDNKEALAELNKKLDEAKQIATKIK